MDLSQAVLNKYDQYEQVNQINLSYTQIATINRLPQHFTNIRFLTLNHCQLHSLSGIEQFEQLESFNFKFNNINHIKELMKINNKHHIKSLNFIGNEIEYLRTTRYESLVTSFPNLIQLNNNDYRFLKICKSKKNDNHMIQTCRIMKKLDNISKYNYIETQKKENSLHEINNISLENVQIIKSISKNNDDQAGNLKKKNLLISTTNAENIQVYQPTATFARQKQIQNNGFPFKKDLEMGVIFQKKTEEDFYKSRKSNLRASTVSNNNLKTSILYQQLQVTVIDQQELMSMAFYNKTLIEKSFEILKLEGQVNRNMPRKKQFFGI